MIIRCDHEGLITAVVRDAGQVAISGGRERRLTPSLPPNNALIVLAVSHGLRHVLVDEIIQLDDFSRERF